MARRGQPAATISATTTRRAARPHPQARARAPARSPARVRDHRGPLRRAARPARRRARRSEVRAALRQPRRPPRSATATPSSSLARDARRPTWRARAAELAALEADDPRERARSMRADPLTMSSAAAFLACFAQKTATSRRQSVTPDTHLRRFRSYETGRYNHLCRVSGMWAVYRNTFVRFQLLIAVVAGAVLVTSGFRWPVAGMFFAVMQIAAVLGAMWARSARRPAALLVLAVGLFGITSAVARADGPAAPPQPDRTGAYQTTPTASSVPGLHQARSGEGDDQGARRRGRRGRAVGVAQLLLDQLRVGAGRRLPRHLHAGRLRAGRDGPDPREERRAHDVDELRGLRARHVRLLRAAASR